MKQLFTILFLFVFLSAKTNAQVSQTFINKVWETTTGNPDTINWSQTTFAGGNTFIVGNTFNGTDADLLLTEFDNNGNLVFQTTYDDGGNDYGIDIKVDMGNAAIYIAGTTDTGTNGYNYLIQRYDINGNLIWTTTYNGTGDSTDIPSSISFDGYSNIFVTGATYDALNNFDFGTIMLDLSGNIIWTRQYDNNGNADLSAVAIADGNRVVIAGTSATSPTNYDIYLTRYDYSGSQGGYIRDTIGAGGIDEVNSVARDYNGDFYITGRVRNGNGDYDIEIVKLDSLLNQVWETSYDGNGNDDVGNDIKVDNYGNVYVCGSVSTSSTHQNGILIKLDVSGNILWQQNIYADNPQQNCISRKLNLFGIAEITVASYVQKGTQFYTSLLTYDNNDEPLWCKNFSYTGSNNDFPISIQRDATGSNLYLSFIASNVTDAYGVAEFRILQTTSTVVNDTFNKPLYLDGQLIVSFDTSVINKNFVNDKEQAWGKLSDVISYDALTLINTKFEYDLSDVPVFKIFTRMTIADSFSISRLGNRIPIEPFWATLGFILPSGFDVFTTSNTLNQCQPYIHYSECVHLANFDAVPNDSIYQLGEFPGLYSTGSIPNANINIEPAWDISTGDSTIKVGVYDGGINYYHKEFGGGTLATSKIKGGYDYYLNQAINASNPPDLFGHGTACAGIIGALRNNTYGIAGVAGGDVTNNNPGVSLYDMRLYTYFGTFAPMTFIVNSIVEGAVLDTVNNYGFGLDIANHSWGGGYDSTLKRAIHTAFINDVLSSCSSGNEGTFLPLCMWVKYPSQFKDEWVLKVGANDSSGSRAAFSNCGWSLDFIAPGTHNLYNSIGINGNNYTDTLVGNNAIDGTSFAAPHASGLAALMLSYINTNPLKPNNLAPEDVEQLMQKYSTDITASPDTIGYDQETGWGRINAGNTMLNIQLPFRKVVHHQFQVITSSAVPEPPVGGCAQSVFIVSNYNLLVNGINFCQRYRISGSDTFNTGGYQLLDVWKRIAPTNVVKKIDSCVINQWLNAVPNDNDFYLDSVVNHTVYVHGYTYEIFGTNIFSNQPDTIWYPLNLSAKANFAYTTFLGDSTFNNIQNNANTFAFNLYPNPTGNNFYIDLSTIADENITIELFDVTGRKVKTLFNGKQNGNHIFNFSSKDLPTGMYFVQLKANQKSETKKLAVIH